MERSKRQYFICQGTGFVPAHVMQAATSADTVYFKEIEHGSFLYALYFEHQNAKQHSTVENSINRLDAMLTRRTASPGTRFVSISTSGKVKSFSGRDRYGDFHFRQIFDIHVVKKELRGMKRNQLQPGVSVWVRVSKADYEYDVVKKRKIMETVDDDEAGETCPEALRHFEEFESQVLDALSLVSQEYQSIRFQELLDMEKDLCTAVGKAQPAPGFLYVAISSAVRYPKIGATRRSDPSLRLRELSCHVPSPFKLVYTVSTLTPFSLEADVHKHFDAFRLREKGACTEFFSVDLESIENFLSQYANFEKH